MAVAVPMESNPEIMNKYLHKLGVSEEWRMVDVMGLEGEALSWVPRPVLAVILLFPLSETYETHRRQQETELLGQGHKPPQGLFHLKQVLSNICGTVALVHSIANNEHHINIADGILKKYINDAKDLSSEARGALLENSLQILDAYREIVADHSEEQSETSNHFVTFINKDGTIFELDGRKNFPVPHGPTTEETFLEDSAKICREFVAREPDTIGFSVVALVPSTAN